MKGDFTRNTFSRAKHYSGVRMQQGRVQLDADWNEQLDIDAYRDHVTHRDVIGYCGGPQGRDADGNELAGFRITASGNDLRIGAGRYYVNGLLVENETEVSISGQFDLPDYDPISSLGTGIYLAYLDVWERHITALEDNDIREVALGGPDTATRTQAMAQVRLERVGEPGDAVDCSDFGPGWVPGGAQSTGRLAARAEPGEDSDTPCIVPPNAGYRRLENQLYRVEIHTGGGMGTATFKWSRENGSIVTRWESQDGNNLTVSSAGKDHLLRFAAGDWVELSDDTRDLQGRAGVLVRLKQVADKVLTIDATTIQDLDDPTTTSVNLADFPRNPRIRRWESDGTLSVVIATINEGWIELEDGVWVHFQAGGVYHEGDYWTIPARTALGDVLWPADEVTGEPAFQLRHGITRSYCPLAIGEFSGNGWSELNDCRKTFPPLTELPTGDQSCCTHTVGDGVHSVGDFQSIQAAMDALDQKRGGTVCILPGDYPLRQPVSVRLPYVAIRGCGRHTRITAGAGAPAFVIQEATKGVHLQDLNVRASAPLGVIRLEECLDVLVEGCEFVNRGRDASVNIGADRHASPAIETHLPYLASKDLPLATGVPHKAFLRALSSPPHGPAIYLRACHRVGIQRSHLFGLPSISAQARDISIQNNHLMGGGSWLWDGSSHANIGGNTISRGAGPGIVLGGLPDGEKPPEDATGVVQVIIMDNHILGMANSGISSVVDAEENLELGELEDIVIAHNRIESCALGGVDPAWEPLAVGGVILRSVTGLRIHDNIIVKNQPAAGGAAAGIFLHLCLGLEVADNQIIDNGGVDESRSGACVDFRSQKLGTTHPNPLTEQGMTFTVVGSRDKLEPQTEFTQIGAFSGLYASRQTIIQLPDLASEVTITLVNFSSTSTVEALGADGKTLAQAVVDSTRRSPQKLSFSAEGMVQLMVHAPGMETLILEVCAGGQANGFQAGIAAWYVLGGELQLDSDALPIDDFQRNTPAAVIRDNIVSTPHGQALMLIGMGSISVSGNSLSSHGLHDQPVINGQKGAPDILDKISQLGKCVSILNFGVTSTFADALLGLSMTKVNYAVVSADKPSTLPDGLTRFDGNQVKLDIMDTQEKADFSTVIFSFDDISAQNNQLTALTPGKPFVSNLVAASPTIRVTGNALNERPGTVTVSCISGGTRQNATLGNQATHCIWALGGDVLWEHNQILIDHERCAVINKQAGKK